MSGYTDRRETEEQPHGNLCQDIWTGERQKSIESHRATHACRARLRLSGKRRGLAMGRMWSMSTMCSSQRRPPWQTVTGCPSAQTCWTSEDSWLEVRLGKALCKRARWLVPGALLFCHHCIIWALGAHSATSSCIIKLRHCSTADSSHLCLHSLHACVGRVTKRAVADIA